MLFSCEVMSVASKLVPQISKTVSIHMPATHVAYQHAYRVPAKPHRYRLASHRSGYPPDLVQGGLLRYHAKPGRASDQDVDRTITSP